MSLAPTLRHDAYDSDSFSFSELFLKGYIVVSLVVCAYLRTETEGRETISPMAIVDGKPIPPGWFLAITHDPGHY